VIGAAELVDNIPFDRRLLLRAVLLDGDAARTAWQAWRAMVVIDDVDGPSQRLLPLLARRLSDVAPDDPVRSLIRGMYRHAWVRSHRLWSDARPTLQTLQDHGIGVLLLKGAALLPAYGGDWGARPMYDIDALVSPNDIVRALDVLEQQGWTAEYDMTFAWIRERALSRRHGWGFLNGDGRLDLHWHALSESLGSGADDSFWAAATPFVIDEFAALGLAPADLVLHLIVHGISGFNAPAIQWVSDVMHVIRRHGATAIADRLASQARAHGELHTVTVALEAIGRILDPVPVAPLLERLSRERPLAVERLRGDGPPGHGAPEALRQLAQRAVGGNGIARGMVELVHDRLDVPLTSSRGYALAYAASGRASPVARLARTRVGEFSRTPSPPPRLGAGATLDFTEPRTLDEYGGPGWGRPEPEGSTTRGGEARLVLPLDDTLLAAM
jgi:hypothetical protein